MNVIEILLLPSRRYTFLNCAKGAVIAAEHNATEIQVKFPSEYEDYSKRVDFVTARGNLWTEKLYVPEFEEYPEGFDKNVFSFTLPNEVTVSGELKMQFVAYMPDETLTAVPFDVIPIYIENGLSNFKKNGKHNPDLLILSYNQSTEALMYSEQARRLSQSADQKADEAVSTANEALETASSVEETARTAETNANDARAVSAAAANTADMAYTAAGNAVLKSNEALANSEEAKATSIIAAEKAESALISKVDKIQGKGLSQNDYTDIEKQKLSGIEENAQVNVQSDWNEEDTESDAYIKNKPTALPADGGNSDTVDGKHASEFATAEQGTKADNAVPNTRKINGKSLNLDITLVPSDIGAATASQGAKADTALQSFTETDPTVPTWAKKPNKPTYTPAEVGAEPAFNKNTAFNKNFGNTAGTVCEGNDTRLSDARPANGGNADTVDGKHASDFATAAQGQKADTALQSFTETDPTVPTWAKAATKPPYSFNEISGILSSLQLPSNLINGIGNISSSFNNETEQWDVSVEIPFVFECDGVNDNQRLSNLIKDFYNSQALADNANLKVVIKGRLGVTNKKLYGSGTYADNYRVFEFGVSGYSGNRRVFLDFSGAEVPEINTIVEGYNYYTIIDNLNIPISIYGLSIIARQTRMQGMSGSGAYLNCFKGNGYTLTDCNISSLNESNNGSYAVSGENNTFNNCSFTVKGSNAVSYAITGNKAKVVNCKFNSLSGDVYTLNSAGAFVQNCHITTTGTSTTQVQCNGQNDCVFINCTLEIKGTGTLRCNSGSNCSFINCNLTAESTDVNSTVSANQGSNCYFIGCKLSAKGCYWSSSGVSGNSASGCILIACTLKAITTRADGYAYAARVWNGVVIGCDLLAYVPENGTGEAIGFHLNSAATNRCIIVGCRFLQAAEAGYKQGPSIVIDGTSSGGQYMITNNIITGEIRTHTLTGSNYVKEPNITGA